MLSFKRFLLEYLTDQQRNRFAHIKMDDKARSNTDHFFGKDNDIVHDEIHHDEGHQEQKSEIHRAVERHLGKEIHHDEYHRGVTKDKYGREVKLGKLIKDEKLRNSFASDSTREGSKKGSVFKTSTVRGTEVAGQTNSAPDHLHPKGHSWGEHSCKNVETGSNNHYLENEIAFGTVVHRVHDHTGKEIYRATLQPHHNKHGHVAYAVDSEYGIKHPAFTKSSHEVAKKLSGEYKPDIFVKHPDVYNDNGARHILHPNANADQIHKALSDRSPIVREAAAAHPNATPEHLQKALNDRDSNVRYAATIHKNANSQVLDKALKDRNTEIREATLRHLNITADHLHKALNDPAIKVRFRAVQHEKANEDHLHKALDDSNVNVRLAAASHPNANKKHLDKAISDKKYDVRLAAARHQNVNADHLHKALNDSNVNVRLAAARHQNVNADHLHKALNDSHESVRKAAKGNPKYKRYFK
jgi:HEAT repeat protein